MYRQETGKQEKEQEEYLPIISRVWDFMSLGFLEFEISRFVQGVPKTHFQNATGPRVSIALDKHQYPTTIVFGNRFFGRFLLRLSRVKPSHPVCRIFFCFPQSLEWQAFLDFLLNIFIFQILGSQNTSLVRLL